MRGLMCFILVLFEAAAVLSSTSENTNKHGRNSSGGSPARSSSGGSAPPENSSGRGQPSRGLSACSHTRNLSEGSQSRKSPRGSPAKSLSGSSSEKSYNQQFYRSQSGNDIEKQGLMKKEPDYAELKAKKEIEDKKKSPTYIRPEELYRHSYSSSSSSSWSSIEPESSIYRYVENDHDDDHSKNEKFWKVMAFLLVGAACLQLISLFIRIYG